MRILINCSNLKIGGGLQVAHSFISSLYRFESHEFIVVASSELLERLDTIELPNNCDLINYTLQPSILGVIVGRNSFLSSLVKEKRVDAVFSVFGPTYWRSKVSHLVGYAKPHYIYTSSPYFKLLGFFDRLRLHSLRKLHLYDFKHNSDMLVTENQDVSDRLKAVLLQKKVFTVTNYYNQVFDDESKWRDVDRLPEFEGVTLLTISSNYTHKNLGIIPKVIGSLHSLSLKKDFRFVVTVEKGHLGKSIAPEIERHIVYLGSVKIEQCPWLYSKADMVFLPTLLECFSASYPEAMRMSKPILTSDLDFARGLCGDAALYFDPLDEQNIAETIIRLSNDKDLKDELIKNGKDQLLTFDDYTTRSNKYLTLLTNML